jgi:hypothetical protein
MFVSVIRWIIIYVLFVFSASSGSANDGEWNAVGLRAGISDQRNEESFSKYEAYATFSLPWRWSSEQGWILGTFIGINAGVVRSGDSSFIGSVGPGLYLMTPIEGVVISGGIYPTYIRQSKFGAEDFGDSFQFTSAFGINVTFYRHWIMGYRFQHMSNGGISDENPGLNTHMMEFGYRF